MSKVETFHAVAELLFAGVEQSADPASEVLGVYELLADLARHMGLLDLAEGALAVAEKLHEVAASDAAAKVVQLKFKNFLNGSKPPISAR
jgi:hypothetical protein